MEKEIKHIVITGGGSGGHISVASALIDGIKNRYPDIYSNITYIGGDLGMVGEEYGNSLEQRIFKDAEFMTEYIRAGKLQRSLSISSIKLAFRTLLGFIDSFHLLSKLKPDLIFSTGGFVSVPVCIAGWLKGIPIYLHEQTAAVGLANQIVGKFAKKIFLTFKSSTKYFKKKETILVGNIVRDAILKEEGEGVVVDFIKGLNNNLPTIYVSGGGLGSHVLNEYFLENISNLLKSFNVILQMGDNQVHSDYDNAVQIKKGLNQSLSERFLPVKYVGEDEIGYMYHNIDMYIGRAGANTVYEMGVLQIPSIFIPIPWVTHDEQSKNAQNLVNLGLSEIIKEGDLKDLNIIEYIRNFLKRDKDINKEKIQQLFTTNALESILNNIFK